MYNDGLHTLVSYLIESFLQCANFVAPVASRQLATLYEARIDIIIKKDRLSARHGPHDMLTQPRS